jgi:hypothetical protein
MSKYSLALHLLSNVFITWVVIYFLPPSRHISLLTNRLFTCPLLQCQKDLPTYNKKKVLLEQNNRAPVKVEWKIKIGSQTCIGSFEVTAKTNLQTCTNVFSPTNSTLHCRCTNPILQITNLGTHTLPRLLQSLL